MITLQEPLIDITMKIEVDLPQTQILEFLKRKGYRIEACRQYYPPTEGILVGESELFKWSFCALKEEETPSSDNDYLKVFEKEMKELLNNL